MLYTLRLRPKAEKRLKNIPEFFQHRLKSALLALQDEPYLGKKLLGQYKGLYSLNIWPYRIIYAIYKKELIVIMVDIGHRQGAYK